MDLVKEIRTLLQEKEIQEEMIDDVFSFYNDCREWIFSITSKKGKCDFTEAACFMYSIIYNDAIEDLENSCDLALECGLKLVEHPQHTILDELKNESNELPTFKLETYKRENFEKYNQTCFELFQDIKGNRQLGDANF